MITLRIRKEVTLYGESNYTIRIDTLVSKAKVNDQTLEISKE